MNDCKCFMGKIFGHSFKRIMIKKGFVLPQGFEIKANGIEATLKLIESTRDVYVVTCKRCGFFLESPEDEK